MPARVASWVRSPGTGVSRSGRARSSAASAASVRVAELLGEGAGCTGHSSYVSGCRGRSRRDACRPDCAAAASGPRHPDAPRAPRRGASGPSARTVAVPSGQQPAHAAGDFVGIESDQLVYDYLSRVGDLAQQRGLPSATRMRLVSGLRAEIDRTAGRFGVRREADSGAAGDAGGGGRGRGERGRPGARASRGGPSARPEPAAGRAAAAGPPSGRPAGRGAVAARGAAPAVERRAREAHRSGLAQRTDGQTVRRTARTARTARTPGPARCPPRATGRRPRAVRRPAPASGRCGRTGRRGRARLVAGGAGAVRAGGDRAGIRRRHRDPGDMGPAEERAPAALRKDGADGDEAPGADADGAAAERTLPRAGAAGAPPAARRGRRGRHPRPEPADEVVAAPARAPLSPVLTLAVLLLVAGAALGVLARAGGRLGARLRLAAAEPRPRRSSRRSACPGTVVGGWWCGCGAGPTAAGASPSPRAAEARDRRRPGRGWCGSRRSPRRCSWCGGCRRSRRAEGRAPGAGTPSRRHNGRYGCTRS